MPHHHISQYGTCPFLRPVFSASNYIIHKNIRDRSIFKTVCFSLHTIVTGLQRLASMMAESEMILQNWKRYLFWLRYFRHDPLAAPSVIPRISSCNISFCSGTASVFSASLISFSLSMYFTFFALNTYQRKKRLQRKNIKNERSTATTMPRQYGVSL